MTIDSQTLITEQANGVVRLCINRPEKHNAFDDQLIKKLNDVLTSINQDPAVRAILLTSRGKHFSAGADLNWMAKMVDYSEADNLDDSRQLAHLLYQLSHSPKLTIALVQGGAFGGGAGLVAACDIALASKNARFCFSEVKLGLIPSVISPYVIGAMGERACRRYFLTAEQFSAEEALQYQLIHQIVDDEKSLLEEGSRIAKGVTRLAPNAIGETKDLIEAVSKQNINQALIDDTARRIARIRTSSEGQEGLRAFLEKRTPSWLEE